MSETRKERVLTLIEKAKARVDKEPDIAIGILYGLPEIEQAGLSELVYLLDKGDYGCHANDVKGVIELLEKYLNKQ